ncbi:Chloride channel protein 2 [Desmophyllum pertusum]|uniref:Chloride channel protein n=1 Tax=Desmophyllum pertusum TaxID=174260 RepID=A0A9X0A8P1_9CNID|nr:Chloride channel protein 2 [Desmophyllum pertusum]
MMEEEDSYGFEQTLMYGRFTTTQLQKYAKEQGARLRREQQQRREEQEQDDDFRTYDHSWLGPVKRFVERLRPCWSRLGSDWVFLLILGIIMALISFVLDLAIDKCQTAHIWLYSLPSNMFLQYIVWTSFPLVLITFSVGFTYLVSPHAIGSGIPEMKVILRGTVLKRYLSLRTLIAKVVGLLTALGSGIPIGKEGPFVHIASMVARSMGKFLASFKGIYTNESRNTEILAAACAVGVSSCFGSPIGGVLFSIEVTATYFAVRNYWRGFFAAVCGALMFRLLAVFDKEEETVTALFKTNFRLDFPFDVEEFIAFALIGLFCGFGGALFVFTHRKLVDIQRTHKHTMVAKFLSRNRFVYPAVIIFIIATITFPKGLGQFMAGELTSKQAIDELFINITWSEARESEDQASLNVLKHWDGANTNIYVTLVIFIVLKFIMTAVSVALPIPAGVFFPVFLIGAAFGRLVGEAMATWFPDGVNSGDAITPIVPGGYAVVGAAAMSAAVTHTISTSVIVFELTGQITHILPVMIAVLIANAIAQWLQPSFYDSIIQIKRLPYLPDLTKTQVYNLLVADIMKTNLFYISYHSKYADLKELLEKSRHRSYPLVDSEDSMILLGSIQRPQLQSLLNQHMHKMFQASSNAESEDALYSARAETPDSLQLQSDEQSSDDQGPPAKLEVLVSAEISLKKQDTLPQSHKSSTGKSLLEKIPVPTRLHRLFGSGSALNDAEKIAEASDKDSPTGDQQAQWEKELLQRPIDFSNCQIDPSPFQLIERTSLLKVHKLFALLNLSHAYVTTLGRLVGVVALKEVRQAIEGERFLDASHVDAVDTDHGNSFMSAQEDVMLNSHPEPNAASEESDPVL